MLQPGTERLWRQVHPTYIDGEIVGIGAFRGVEGDRDRVSTSRAEMETAQGAFEFYSSVFNLRSAGTWSVSTETVADSRCRSVYDARVGMCAQPLPARTLKYRLASVVEAGEEGSAPTAGGRRDRERPAITGLPKYGAHVAGYSLSSATRVACASVDQSPSALADDRSHRGNIAQVHHAFGSLRRSARHFQHECRQDKFQHLITIRQREAARILAPFPPRRPAPTLRRYQLTLYAVPTQDGTTLHRPR